MSSILKTKNTTFQKPDLCVSSGEGEGDIYSVGPLTKSYSPGRYTALSSFLEYWLLDKVQTPSDYEIHSYLITKVCMYGRRSH
jgi:hypothetical protein